MKKLTISIILITLASMAVFAAGSAEDNTMPWSGVRGQYQSEAVISEESSTLTGIINLVEDGHMELVVGDETYELVYPYRLSYAADLQDGQEITVEGFEAENLRLDNSAETKNLVLTSATIDGETYDLADVSDTPGAYGQRGNQVAGFRTDDDSTFQGQGARGSSKGSRMSNRMGGSFQDNLAGRGRR
jgi:hypothetical protein